MNLINHPQKTISVGYTKLRSRAAAVTYRNEDGSYTILLNPIYSQDRLLKAFEHELRHIEMDHHDGGDIQLIELEAKGTVDSVPKPTLFGIPVSEYAAMNRRQYEARKRKRRKQTRGRTPDWVVQARKRVGL